MFTPLHPWHCALHNEKCDQANLHWPSTNINTAHRDYSIQEYREKKYWQQVMCEYLHIIIWEVRNTHQYINIMIWSCESSNHNACSNNKWQIDDTTQALLLAQWSRWQTTMPWVSGSNPGCCIDSKNHVIEEGDSECYIL